MAEDGEVFVDHRASPGIPEDMARRMGYDPSQVKEGAQFRAAFLMCRHCKQPAIKNPLRTRERAYCMACAGAYICDLCDAERRKPDYVHLPDEKIRDLVGSGKVICMRVGVQPLLVPVKPQEI